MFFFVMYIINVTNNTANSSYLTLYKSNYHNEFLVGLVMHCSDSNSVVDS